MTNDRQLLRSYAGDARQYDELLDETGEIRAHWRPLLEHLSTQGPDAARRGVELARRLIIENGVTYNVYADPQGKDRPWTLDPLPFLLQPAEWSEIEAGVAQRAEVLDRLLADLYGPQSLLAEGILPPELPFGHPNFAWPCQGIRPRGGRWLHFYAADLARAPDGRWWVLGDRTQTPSGAGYALENRQIVTRLFSELIQALPVRPLDDFFATLRAEVLRFAEPGDTPLAVVLTPGPFNETYFEHAYLAQQLGLPLVEGHDLTMRGDTVHLKTIGGLRRVHAILRRLDDDFCDPLELRADSALGIPGLIHAVRAGRVAVANAIGSGVLESAAWLGFLPGIAERLLGEELRLPSVATWWCGERPALDYVIANLHRLVVKPTYPNQKFEPVFGRDLDTPERELLCDRLHARPHAFVAQERMTLSQAPVWRPGGALSFRARSLGIRVYAVATPSGFRVMPGGMARIAVGDLADVLSTQRGGGSKDLWVLANGATRSVAAEPAEPSRPIARNDDLPSRLAENLYWFGRYAERCEDKTRLLRATLTVRSRPEIWPKAVEACGLFEASLPGAEGGGDPLAGEQAAGLANDLRRLGDCASEVRGRLSSESWRIVARLATELDEVPRDGSEAREKLDRILLGLSALAGLAHDDMTQDDGWKIMMLGRRLERLQFLSLLLSHQLGSQPPLQGDLEWILDVGDSTITYRTRFLATPQLESVLDLLVHDERNPRALAYQWHVIRRLLSDLVHALGETSDTVLEPALDELWELRERQLNGSDEQTTDSRWEIGNALARVATAAEQLSDLLSARHFSHTDFELQTVAT